MIRPLIFLISAAVGLYAQSPTALYSFLGGPDGHGPHFLILGADGNFYGGTVWGGGPSVVFKLTPAGGFSILATMGPLSNAGSLVYGKDGNLYGTSSSDGSCQPVRVPNGCGTVFQLTPAGARTNLYDFQDESDGFNPYNLIQGADGNFYGLTASGTPLGASDRPSSMGSVFKITPGGALTALVTFTGPNGDFPRALIQATNGNLYGATAIGGTGPCKSGCGTIFEIMSDGSFTVLYDFQGAEDGSEPEQLVQGTDGNLYGITNGSNSSNTFGTFFKLTPSGIFTTLHSFVGTEGPPDTLVAAVNGNFYGSNEHGGTGACTGGPSYPAGCGTIFELTPTGLLTILSNLDGTLLNNTYITALVQGLDGNLYGTSNTGGTNDDGAFFAFTLPSPNTPTISVSDGVVNGASFQAGISPGSWITINGTNFATQPATWAITNGALPTTTGSVSVSVGGQPAYVEYVSSTQINAIAPIAPVGSVPVIVTTPNGVSQAVKTQLSDETPAFFQWGTYAVATHQDYTYAVKNGTFAGLTTVPAKPGDVIILWGTGFGPTSPAVPAGMETPSNIAYNTATAVSVTVGGKTATVYGAALASGYAGLYQVAIQIPAGLTNGDYPVVATIDGVLSPTTTLITVQH